MSSYKKLIDEVFALHNKIRTDPKSFIPYLEKQLENFNDLIYLRKDPDGDSEIETREGKKGVLNAINYLKNTKKCSPLDLHKDLCHVAYLHAKDLGDNGLYESRGSDGRFPDKRIKDYVDFTDKIGESLDFNFYTANDIIYSCIVDDDVDDKSRRKNFFSSSYNYIGIGICDHVDYGNCIVLDYVGGINPKSSSSNKKVFEKEEKDEKQAKENNEKIINGLVSNEKKASQEGPNSNINKEREEKKDQIIKADKRYSEEFEEEEIVIDLPDNRYLKKIDNLDECEEIEDDECPEDAIGVQVIVEHVRTKERTYLRQIKVYHNHKMPVEIITKKFDFN